MTRASETMDMRVYSDVVAHLVQIHKLPVCHVAAVILCTTASAHYYIFACYVGSDFSLTLAESLAGLVP